MKILLKLTDCHVHLQDYEENLIERVLNDCEINNIKYLVCNSTSEKDFDKVTKLKEKYPSVIAGYGLHPW